MVLKNNSMLHQTCIKRAVKGKNTYMTLYPFVLQFWESIDGLEPFFVSFPLSKSYLGNPNVKIFAPAARFPLTTLLKPKNVGRASKTRGGSNCTDC